MHSLDVQLLKAFIYNVRLTGDHVFANCSVISVGEAFKLKLIQFVSLCYQIGNLVKHQWILGRCNDTTYLAIWGIEQCV